MSAHPKPRMLLQAQLTARFDSFARQRSYSYASLQELPNRTRQPGFRYARGAWDGR